MGTEKKAGDLEEIQVLEGISESEEIDRRVEELMAPEEEGNGLRDPKAAIRKTIEEVNLEEKAKAKDRTPVIGGRLSPCPAL